MPVLARRIIVVSPESAFRWRLEAALAALAGAVDAHAGLYSIGAAAEEAALCVIHLVGELAGPPGELLAYLPGSCPVIAVSPRGSLADAVALMQATERVAAMMVAEDLDAHQLSLVAARLIADDVFGLEKLMPPGTELHARQVGDHREKGLCLASIAELIDQVGAPRRFRAPIEQCVDEMLMNALYDAPVDARGEPLFAGVPAKVRITERTEQRAAVQYACDGRRFAVAVRDAFGTLARETVLRHLHKGLHAEQQVDRKVGGAGLGLYLMVTSATAVHFHVLPGFATEAVCVFDLQAPRPALEQLGFLVQRNEAGQVRVGPAHRLAAGPRARSRAVSVALGATLVLAGGLLGALVLPRRLGCAGAGAPDEPPPVATVELDSQPTGAAVEIDGRPVGSTPLTLTQLAPGRAVSIAFKRVGYRAATARLVVPAVGDRKQLVQPLQLSDDAVRVRFVSNPPGAEVIETGKAESIDRTYTPAEVFVEAGKVQRFTLTMPNHVPLVIEPFTPRRGAGVLEKGGDLVEGATLHVEAPPGGKASVSGAPHCKDLAPPFDCTLAPGIYAVEYIGADGTKATRRLTMGTQDMTATL